MSPDPENAYFLDPYAEVTKHDRRLPHWSQDGVWSFVTWRLADSLPAQRLREIEQEQERWVIDSPPVEAGGANEAFKRRIAQQIETYLDQGAGSCLLENPTHAQVVADVLCHFEGQRYGLAAFVIMPNHVHAIFRPLGGLKISEIIRNWKGYSAYRLNDTLGLTGSLWHEEYWDRLIRDEGHFARCLDYVRRNPAKACLKNGEFLLFDAYADRS